MASGYEHHFGPRSQTDAQAANSAMPDTDRKPLWDDPGYDAYLFAVDADYRIDWYLAHGDEEAARDVAEEQRERKIKDGEWTDEDELEFELAWADDDEEEHDPGCPGGDNCRCFS